MDLKHQLYIFPIRLKDIKTLNYKEFKNLKIFFGLSMFHIFNKFLYSQQSLYNYVHAKSQLLGSESQFMCQCIILIYWVQSIVKLHINY